MEKYKSITEKLDTSLKKDLFNLHQDLKERVKRLELLINTEQMGSMEANLRGTILLCTEILEIIKS